MTTPRTGPQVGTGGGLRIAEGASLDDGLLEVVIVDRLSLLAIAWRLPALFRGTLKTGNGVTMKGARQVRVRSAEEIPFHVDGEPRLGRRELQVQAVPGALAVRVAAL